MTVAEPEISLADFRRYFPYTPAALCIKECMRLTALRRHACPGPILDVGAHVLRPDAPLPYPDGALDLVVSMDVIEHVVDPVPWTREALRVLRPHGVLFLTTPNYGSRSLRVLEHTVLEAIARIQNFSRKGLHPTQMTAERLRSVLSQAGASHVRIEPIAFGWGLAAYCRRS